jgi:hypothetical protein
MTSTVLTPPDIDISEAMLDIAEQITLADLLECRTSRADALAMISSFTRNSSRYDCPGGLTADEERVELVCMRVTVATSGDQRARAFAHLKERNAQ